MSQGVGVTRDKMALCQVCHSISLVFLSFVLDTLINVSLWLPVDKCVFLAKDIRLFFLILCKKYGKKLLYLFKFIFTTCKKIEERLCINIFEMRFQNTNLFLDSTKYSDMNNSDNMDIFMPYSSRKSQLCFNPDMVNNLDFMENINKMKFLDIEF